MKRTIFSLILCVSAAFGQSSFTMRVQSNGTTVKTAASYLVLNFSTNLTATSSGNTVSVSVSGLGSAAALNTGTSGATIPLLNTANTWSNAQTLATWTAVGASAVTLSVAAPTGATANYAAVFTGGNVGIGTTSPTSLLQLAAGTTSVAPLGLTSGALLTTTVAGKIEFNIDNYYGTITTGAGAGYVSDYPPAQTDTYVKATTKYSTDYWPYYATDPAKSLTGTHQGNAWISGSNVISNQRFHIDLGSAKIIAKIYYENEHTSGTNTNAGVKNFTLWGSNSATAFADLTYSDDSGWTQITASPTLFAQHVSSDVADPQYITVFNSTAYRYYALKFIDDWGGTSYMAVRRIELQEGNSARKTFVMADNGNLVLGRIPFATTNGRLTDSSNLTYDGTSLTVSGTGNTTIGGNVGIGTTSPVSKLSILLAAVATANYGTISLGAGPFDGTTAGKFVGSANGTQFAINAASGSTSDLAMWQVAGVTQFQVSAAGVMTLGGSTFVLGGHTCSIVSTVLTCP